MKPFSFFHPFFFFFFPSMSKVQGNLPFQFSSISNIIERPIEKAFPYTESTRVPCVRACPLCYTEVINTLRLWYHMLILQQCYKILDFAIWLSNLRKLCFWFQSYLLHTDKPCFISNELCYPLIIYLSILCFQLHRIHVKMLALVFILFTKLDSSSHYFHHVYGDEA